MSILDYFKKNYIQKFEISEREKQLMDLAKEYHDSCDAYDDRICSGKNEYKESTPRTSVEFNLINKKTYLTIELGLQTTNENTSKLINRCHSLTCFENMVKKLRDNNIDVVVHIKAHAGQRYISGIEFDPGLRNKWIQPQ